MTSPDHFLRRTLRRVGELPGRLDAALQDAMRSAFLRRRSAPVLPADVRKELQKAMFDRDNILEDARYQEIVPNEYVVELNRTHYEHHFQPIEWQLTDQWRQWLLNLLDSTNSRYGERRYRFGGRVSIKIQPADDLEANQVRVRGRIDANAGQAADASLPACLELLPAGRRWRLHEGLVVLGRDRSCDVHLDAPIIQEKRLISGQHAYLRCQHDHCRVFDGSPEGKPSVNGTFVNGARVRRDGQELEDGDILVLAAPDPTNPRPDLPGSAGFIYRANCP